jgi:CheY-like chemotaxis protein
MMDEMNPQVLIVEDDDDIRDLVKEFLDFEGYSVRTFSNGPDALESLSKGLRPQVILVDWRMPQMSGSEFIRGYHELCSPTELAAVYIFSAESNHAVFQDVTFSGILAKPLDLKSLLMVLDSEIN